MKTVLSAFNRSWVISLNTNECQEEEELIRTYSSPKKNGDHVLSISIELTLNDNFL